MTPLRTNCTVKSNTRGNSILAIDNAIFGLILIGLALMPFSSDKDSDFKVVSFGFPFILAASLTIVVRFMLFGCVLVAHLRELLFFAFMYVCFFVCMSFIATNFIPSLARVSFHVLGFIVFVYIVSFVFENRDRRAQWNKRFSYALIISGTLLSLYYLINNIVVVFDKGIEAIIYERYVGGSTALPWGATNVISAVLIIPLAVIIARLSEYSNNALKVAAFLIVLSIVTTLSRMGLVTIVFIVISLSLINKNAKYVWGVLVVLFCILLSLYYFNEDAFSELYRTRVEEMESVTGEDGRFDTWSMLAEYLIKYPFNPVGYYGAQSIFGTSGHNIVLTTLVESGIVGLVITVMLFVQLLLIVLENLTSYDSIKKHYSKSYLVGLLAIALNLLAEDPQYTQQFIIYFWTFAGTLCISCIPEKMSSASYMNNFNIGVS